MTYSYQSTLEDGSLNDNYSVISDLSKTSEGDGNSKNSVDMASGNYKFLQILQFLSFLRTIDSFV